jgi:hypothetical protein
MILTRNEIIQTLKHSNCTVKFTKVNGETREMPCTLQEGVVPAYERKTPVKEAKEPTDVLSVWCLDKQAWRSFRVSSVQEVRVDFGKIVAKSD